MERWPSDSCGSVSFVPECQSVSCRTTAASCRMRLTWDRWWVPLSRFCPKQKKNPNWYQNSKEINKKRLKTKSLNFKYCPSHRLHQFVRLVFDMNFKCNDRQEGTHWFLTFLTCWGFSNFLFSRLYPTSENWWIFRRENFISFLLMLSAAQQTSRMAGRFVRAPVETRRKQKGQQRTWRVTWFETSS